jgi:hypothetical protein
VAISAEDAHIKTMSPFETDEHRRVDAISSLLIGSTLIHWVVLPTV